MTERCAVLLKRAPRTITSVGDRSMLGGRAPLTVRFTASCAVVKKPLLRRFARPPTSTTRHASAAHRLRDILYLRHAIAPRLLLLLAAAVLGRRTDEWMRRVRSRRDGES